MVQNMIGLIKLRVVRGVNLVVKDYFKKSSDPYVIVLMGKQKLKTRVMKRTVNPEWNQDMTLVVEDSIPLIKFEVYDKDKFTRDDLMGSAELDVLPFVEVVKMNLEGIPNGTTIKKVTPSRQNCLAEESFIRWSNGKVVQHVVLRLRNVESGLIELQLEWVTIPGIGIEENMKAVDSVAKKMSGLLRVRLVRGVNLAIRDKYIKRSSDPYVILKMGKQKLCSRVKRRNLNPEWNEEFTFALEDPTLPIIIEVYDKDTFTRDDPMGKAWFDIKPFVEAVKMNKEGVQDGTVMTKTIPNRKNCLAEQTLVKWSGGKVVEDVVLRLQSVEKGLVELQLEWIPIANDKIL